MPRALINVHSFFQDFNPSKFTVYSSLLAFSVLFSLKLDNRLNASYWFIFLPLWIWKSLTLLGASVGIIVWLRNPEYRILVCDKLETKRHTWTLVFVPLVFISLLSISVCVWSVKNGRGIVLEFFAAINILQIILIALKLDNFLNWSWIVVFIPSWILLCFAIVVILYAMIFAAIVLRSPDVGSEQRRASIHSASSSSMIFLPLLVFIILLTSKLDSPPNMATPGYFVTCLPLFLTLMILIRMSFGTKSGSLWWFGMRSDFCTYLLTIFPCLKEYGNTSYTINSSSSRPQARNDLVGDSSSQQPQRDSASNIMTLNGSDTHSSGNSHDITASGSPSDHSNAKRLLYNFSKVFSRDKGQLHGDKNKFTNHDAPMMAKLSIDMPD